MGGRQRSRLSASEASFCSSSTTDRSCLLLEAASQLPFLLVGCNIDKRIKVEMI